MSGRYLPSVFKNDHPDLYGKTCQRLAVGDEDMDTLVSYLCKTFPNLLVGTSRVYGHVQRLEDLVDYILCRCQSDDMDDDRTADTG